MKSDTKIKSDILTLSDSSEYVGVSTRTIERHAVMTGYAVEKFIQNGRKVNGYSKTWLDRQFKNVVSDEPKQKPNNQKVKDKTDTKMSDFVVSDNSDNSDKEQISFLKQEIQFKNELINKLQDSNIALIDSEQKTKMLLADLQLQQKNLLLDKPSAKQLEKKSSKIWWALFSLLVAISGVILYFGIHFIQDLINKIHF